MPAPAPFLLGHEDKNDEGDNGQENQRPEAARRFDAEAAMGQRLRNQQRDLSTPARRDATMKPAAGSAVRDRLARSRMAKEARYQRRRTGPAT